MPVLHNRISNDALKAKMLAESEPRTTISFYKYFHIADPKATRDALYQLCLRSGFRGFTPEYRFG